MAILSTATFAVGAAVSLWVIGWGAAHVFAFFAMLLEDDR